MDVWQGGLVDIGGEGSHPKINSLQTQGTEVLVIALVVVVWFLIIAIILLRWNRQQNRQEMHYRCIAAKPDTKSNSMSRDILVRHNGPSLTSSVRQTSEEDAHLVSEIELNELSENLQVSKI